MTYKPLSFLHFSQVIRAFNVQKDAAIAHKIPNTDPSLWALITVNNITQLPHNTKAMA